MVVASFLLLLLVVGGNAAYTKQLRDQQVATCESSNESRALNVRLWDYVLSFPPSRPRTQAQEKQLELFKAFMRKTFAPRDCTKI